MIADPAAFSGLKLIFNKSIKGCAAGAVFNFAKTEHGCVLQKRAKNRKEPVSYFMMSSHLCQG